jgi:hypothetical protein
LLERFPILRSRPEGVPQDVRDVVRTPSLGMNLDLAQRIPVAVAGTYWLVPADGYLCVMHHGSLGIPAAGMNCAPVADAVTHGVANVAIGPDAPGSARRVRLIVGMTPRGARKVLIRTRGSTTTVPVEGDVFVLRDSLIAPPDSIASR